jgi:hypothetical protein
MKKKSLSELLKKLDNARQTTDTEMINLNDQLIKQLQLGGYRNTNDTCSGGNNLSCYNGSCTSGSNGDCFNNSCLV